MGVADQIEFHAESGGRELSDPEQTDLRTWIAHVIEKRGGEVGPINYIFCGDAYLHQMNVQYLDHDTLTDIITFPYGTFPVVSGDLFISTERVSENAVDHGTSYREELCRVVIHGILHLCGQGDKTPAEAKAMRQLEDWAIRLKSSATD